MSWFRKLADHARAENEKDYEIFIRQEQYRNAQYDAAQKALERRATIECCANCLYYDERGRLDDSFRAHDYCSQNEIMFDDSFNPWTRTCIYFFNKNS